MRFVKVLDLRHYRYPSIDVYGKVMREENGKALILLPLCVGHGESIERELSQIEDANQAKIPLSQLQELGVSLRTAVPELFG